MSVSSGTSTGPTSTDLGPEQSGFRARVTDHLAVAVGTTKGLFIVSDGFADGPLFEGNRVPAFLQLGRRYLAAPEGFFEGVVVRTSADEGATWSDPTDPPLAFPADIRGSVAQVCQLQPDRGATGGADVILAGVEPAALFRSSDGGATFELVRGLWDHPHREHWRPGCGGLGLHTILTHPERPGRIIVAISAGGVYRSDDGGRSWAARNAGIGSKDLPGPAPEFGQCVHKVALEASNPDVLWAQNHQGTYRSEDAGDTWMLVGASREPDGLPSDFGFPVVTHPIDAGSAFVIPLESEEHPFSPGGDCRVYRTTDGGWRWTGLGEGLPSPDARLTVLGETFAIGSATPFPLVFGTRTGEVFASADNGETWRSVVSELLPPVLCVRVLE